MAVSAVQWIITAATTTAEGAEKRTDKETTHEVFQELLGLGCSCPENHGMLAFMDFIWDEPLLRTNRLCPAMSFLRPCVPYAFPRD